MSHGKGLTFTAAIAALLLPALSAQAVTSIGLNFVGGRSGAGGAGGGGGDGELMLSGDTAGVFPQSNWNNGLGSNNAGPVGLNDGSGAASGATVSWSGVPNSWTISGSAAADGNGRLMNGYLDTNNSGGSTDITVNDVPYPRYDVYVYKDGDAGSGRSGDYTVNGVTQTDLREPANWPVTTAGGGSFSQATTGNAGNFALFQGASGSTLTVNADESASGGGLRAPVNGLQIVEVGGYANSVYAANPIAYYRFQETAGTTAFDSAGTNNGTYIGSPDLTAAGPTLPGFSSINAATAFDRANSDAVNTPISLSGAQQFTVEGWVNASTIAQNNRTGLFGQNDVIEFGYINDGTIELWTPASGANQVPAPPDDQWFHVAAVGAGRTTQIYINGQLAGLDTHGALGGGGYGTSGDLVNIGGDGVQDAGGNFFLGAIDDVAVFDRALSLQEIQRQIRAANGVDEPRFEGFSANFVGGGGGAGNSGPRTVDEIAGVIELDNWNNLDGADSTMPVNLTRSDGSSTSVSVEWSSNNMWTTDSVDDGANGSLYRGYLDTGDGGAANGASFSITGLPQEFAEGYDLLVYFNGDAGGRFGEYTVDDGFGTMTLTGNDELAGDINSAMFQGFFLDAGTANDSGNFLLFEGLTGLDVTLSSAATDGFRAPISGFQLVRQLPPIPEPATGVLGLMGLAALAWRRRRAARA